MSDKTIFTFTVYDDDSDGRVYWDAEGDFPDAEQTLKVIRMLQACQSDLTDTLIKSLGINISNEILHRKRK